MINVVSLLIHLASVTVSLHLLKQTQELSVISGAAARLCSAWNNSLSKFSHPTFVLSYLVGLFPVAEAFFSPFAGGLCWVDVCREGEEQVFHILPPPSSPNYLC